MVTLTDIVAVLNLIFQDDMADAIRRDVLLPNLLGVKPGRNGVCTWNAKFTGRDTARTDDGSDAVPGDFSTHTRLTASLPWGRYTAFAAVDGLAAAVAARNGPGSVGRTVDVDLLMEEVGDAVDELALLLSQHCYAGDSGASPAEISGADTMAAGAIYAGIDGTALNGEWTVGTGTASKATLEIADLRAQLHRPFRDATGKFPDFVTCDGVTFDLVGSLFDGDIRYVDNIQNASGETVNLKRRGGFRAIEVDGVVYIEDRHATADKLYAWSMRHTSFEQVDPYESALVTPARINRALNSLGRAGVTDDDIAERMKQGRQRLQPTMIALAKGGDSEKVMAKLYCQLKHSQRKAHAQMTLTA